MNSEYPASAKPRLAELGAYSPTALSTGDAEVKEFNVISLAWLAAENIAPSTASANGPASGELRILVDISSSRAKEAENVGADRLRAARAGRCGSLTTRALPF